MEDHVSDLTFADAVQDGKDTIAEEVQFMEYLRYLCIYVVLFCCLAICSQVCHNGGSCTSPGNCTCKLGWKGYDCQTCA